MKLTTGHKMNARGKSFRRISLSAGLVFWVILMPVITSLLIYSIIVIFNGHAPLFTKGNIAECCFGTSSIINLGLGINYLIIKKRMPRKTGYVKTRESSPPGEENNRLS